MRRLPTKCTAAGVVPAARAKIRGETNMRIGLLSAAALLMAGSTPLWAQSNEQAVIQATVDSGCELSREEARRALRGSGMTPQEVRAIIRDLVAQGRGRIDGGTFVYQEGACAPKTTQERPKPAPAERTETEAPAAEATDEAAAESSPENRMDDMVALIRANDCEMTEAQAEVVFDAARLGYLEVAIYLTNLVDDGQASLDGRTVVLSSELCKVPN